jgi:hypothetical protein
MAHGYNVVLLALSHVEMVVAGDLSSRYCPRSKGAFLLRVLVVAGMVFGAALMLFFAANRGRKQSARRAQLLIVAVALLLLGIGGIALVLFGLSGCRGTAAEGLIWNWP